MKRVVILAIVVLTGGLPCFGPGLHREPHKKRTASTSAKGRYTFSQLLPGSYELSAEAAGFKKFVQQGITLGANQSAELNVAFQIGSTTESIEVTAAATLQYQRVLEAGAVHHRYRSAEDHTTKAGWSS